MLKQNSVTLSSGTASYLEKPSDDTSITILMIHGNSLSKETFIPQLESGLFDEYRLIAVDLPGHGDTKMHSNITCSLKSMAEFISEFADKVIDEEILLVGHSLGGHLCIQAASEISKLKGFFLMGTPPLTSSEMEATPFNNHLAMGLLFKDKLKSDELESIANSMHFNSPETAKRIKEAFLKTNLTLRSSLGASVASGEYKDELYELERIGMTPALVLGEKDELIHAVYVKEIAKSIGWQHKVHTVPSAGHTVQLEAPDAVNSLIVEYISFLDSEVV